MVLTVLSIVNSLPAFASDTKILILHSYHQEYPWTKGQNSGFVFTLKNDPSLQPPSFSTEYLDTKRVKFTKKYQDFFFRYLKQKYKDLLPNVIFSTDDNALQFLLRYKSSLFPGVPVVFSGVNNLKIQERLDSHQYVGVYEKKEIEPNIAFITKVQPDLKTIHFIGDNSSTYEAIKVEVQKEMTSLYPNLLYSFFGTKHLSTLLSKLKSLNKGVVFLTTMGGFHDDKNNLIPLHKVIDTIQARTTLPVISMEDAYVQKGILGGYVTSGNAQGKAAAGLLARILKGSLLQNMDSIHKSPNIFMFHHESLNRFGIHQSHLPTNSLILEQPESFFYLYKKHIILVLLFIFFQTLVILFLIKNIAMRKKAERSLERSNEMLEARVSERTAALREYNEMLQAEIKERSQVEDKLSVQETRLRTVISNLPVILWAIDLQGRITLSAGDGLKKLGLSEGEVVGRSIYQVYDHNYQIIDNIQKALAGNTFSSVIEEDGSVYESHYAPFYRNDNIAGVLGFSIDISERTLLEEQLRQSQKMEAIGTLAGGIAHDFNNILQGVFGFIDLALYDLKDEKQTRHYLTEIKKGALRSRDLVRQILTFSRKKSYKLEPLHPVLIIKDTLKLLHASLPTSITIEEKISNDCGLILADVTSLHQILMNLCTNALHAMEYETGVLTISLCQKELSSATLGNEPDINPGPFLELMVKDTGHGLDDTTLGRIFDPFFTKKEVGKGTGLGLAVVHGTVRDFGGFIRVESAPGKGATFYIYIPSYVSEEDKVVSDKNEKPPQYPTGTERIMFIDDEITIVQLQKFSLEKLGYTVAGLIRSSEALELFKEDPDIYDLIITDQTMPELSGIRLAEEILQIRADIPILLFSGYSSMVSEEKAKQVGVRAFVHKPLELQHMATLIRKTLDENK